MFHKKGLAILGSTGSIGKQTIEVALDKRERLDIISLSTNTRVDLLRQQIELTKPLRVAIADDDSYNGFTKTFGDGAGVGVGVDVRAGMDGVISLCEDTDVDMVLNGLVGSVGLLPTMTALKHKKRLCLSNKESLVVGGDLVTRLVDEDNPIIPVDSEHNAIFQCLEGHPVKDVKKVIITASGGPFRGLKTEDLKTVSRKQALAHPRWDMGPKITVDSATLMNKGLEVIEAHYLFGIPYERIEVVVHPQSTVHSMVEFTDGSIIAHLGPTDMRLPIQFALTYPDRLEPLTEGLDMRVCEDLTFEKVDADTFKCLSLCYEAGKAGRTYPAVLNAANEEAVAAFLKEQIAFLDIQAIIEEVVDSHDPEDVTGVEVLDDAQDRARRRAGEIISKIRSIKT